MILLPDLGDLYRVQPHFNAGTMVELSRFLGLRGVTWASSPDPDHPLRDALPAAGIAIHERPLPDWAWADAEHEQLVGFLNQYPAGRERLRAAARAEHAFTETLTAPLTPARLPESLDAARAYHAALRAALDEGPGTRWHARRLDDLAAGLADGLAGESGAVLVPLDDLPGLLDRLPIAELPTMGLPTTGLPSAQLPDLSTFQPGEMSRLRALADRAWQLNEDDDLGVLLTTLDRESGDAVTPRADLQAAAAGICLAVGDLDAARARLEAAAHALQGELPRSLPGLTLARLGQVRDAQGERDLALRTYRAVLALSYAPQVALEAARAGLAAPFVLAMDALATAAPLPES